MTANDSDVSDGETLTGSQVVRVYGENLTSPFVTLTFGGVEYTPLAQGEDYIEFIMTDNGTAIIAVDGSRFMSFEVEGITTPSTLTGYVRARLVRSATSYEDYIAEVSTDNGCVNMPYMVNQDYTAFRVRAEIVEGSTILRSDIDMVNCSIEVYGTTPTAANMSVVPTDVSKVCYLIYEGFIFFVGNYTATD